MTELHALLGDCHRRVDTATGTVVESDTLDGRRLECVAADGAGRVFVGTFDAGLWRSTDGGETFEQVSLDETFERASLDETFERASLDETTSPGETASPPAVTAVAVAADDPAEVWVGTEPSGVYRSTDGGETFARRPGLTDLDSADEWSFPPRPDTHHVRWLAPDPSDPDRWYVAVEAGALVRTPDRGMTWRDRVADGPRDTHTIATHPDRPETAWVAAGDGFAVTTDGGETWSFPTAGLERTYCWSLAVDPDDPDRLLVSAARSAREAHTAARAETYVYRRAGDDWERLDGRGLPLGEGVTRPVLCRGGDAGECFALSNRGLFRTTDWGDSWEAVGVEWPERVETGTARGLTVVE
ncbi:WD40/YVTN/BNR-like repeat-containing protein [Halobaculum sp. MBLA0143]|uniref:WD40/YVTN/BNR-like repeat-containing protein n=1 Tax=Halobaculum sp. MBLA0143 TaxID=3079933 RepID=UPI003525FE06